ncbi:ABC-2 type transport system permease protein [Halobacillus karajensis]|uniref:DUF6449 domain-containing protein n=1 Tax=Halobacillus karajensis TaxID=195088 RepID=A0A024PAC9_9BACI|nr:DUF6449 domain-containing protein [Halobacillus karajensis]CDQ21447.1 hypothetical protein BN982_03833 [Halobacillus karajensis]CDQ25382.1 hypothetical protein BN983_03713 [Halobacillus karajensis]CDQ29706.1 hypothetical protein BN981_04127 [Halobacillus karajensis]SEI07728.1 ABC-2 type transport system permease protein [Halobacillus karajensis]
MRSKTLSFNKEIIKQDFRNVGWVSIVYFLGLFFTLPMQLFMEMSREEPRIPNGHGLFSSIFTYELQLFFLFVMPVLMAVFLFRYLHVKGASDFAHSFPMKRGRLFNHHILSGVILLILPILLNYLILFITAGVADVESYYKVTNLSYWLWLFSSMTLLIFMVGVFVGTLTGLSAVQGILTYILLVLPAGLYTLIAFHLSSYIKGYSGDVVLEQSIQYFSPLADLVKFQRYGPDTAEVPVGTIPLIIYSVVMAVFYIASLFLYKKRPLESAGRALAVRALNPVFKVGVTFCFALFGGMYFTVSQYEYGWMITGYLIGGTVGYAGASMLLEKTWRIFNGRHLKGWFAYGAFTGALIALIPFLWQNYESYVPERSEVDRVYVSGGYWQYQSMVNEEMDIPFITSPEAIQSTIDLHEQLIEVSDPLEGGRDYFFFVYQMKDGSEIYRQYSVDDKEVSEAKKAVYETEGYKNIQYPVLALESDKVNQISIDSYSGQGRKEFYDPEQITGFMEAVKEDIEGMSYEDIVTPRGLYSGVHFTVDGDPDNPFHFQLHLSFEKTMDWLKQEGFYEEAMTLPEDIHRADVYRWPQNHDFPHTDARFILDRLKEAGVEPLEVKGNEEIGSLMEGQSNQEKGAYIVAFYFDERYSDHYEVLSFDNGQAPGFIKEHFE